MMATSSRKRFSECEQDIKRTSKHAKVHKGDGHYMEDSLILGVIFLDTHSSCCICKGKVQRTSAKLGWCDNCNMLQCIDRCKERMPAKLVMEAKEMTNSECIHTDSSRKCQGVVMTEEALLTANPFNLTFSGRDVITSFVCYQAAFWTTSCCPPQY